MGLLWFSFGILVFLGMSLLAALAAGDLRLRRFYQRREWFVSRAEQANTLVARLQEEFYLEPPEEDAEEKQRIRLEDQIDEETQAQVELLDLINAAARENPAEFAAAIRQTIGTDLGKRSKLSVFDVEPEAAPAPVAAAS
ncbi:MAG: hypothetical protein AAF581_07365 [Planctomycetota bacterium]